MNGVKLTKKEIEFIKKSIELSLWLGNDEGVGNSIIKKLKPHRHDNK